MEMKKEAMKTSDKKVVHVRDPNDRERVPKASQKPLTDGRGSAPKIPPDVGANLERACNTGQWLVAVFRINDEKLFLDRTATNFPKADIDLACRLFVENVQELKK